MVYRGSSSSRASEYKQQGHTDENLFSELIGGSTETGSHTGKTDVIVGDTRYTVKGASKKWQIFLYGYERFKADTDFKNMNGIGDLFIDCLDSFPADYNTYVTDKDVVKKVLADYARNNPTEKALKDINKLIVLLPEENSYFTSKLKLKEKTEKLKKKFTDKNCLRTFLDKAMFNLAEVDRMAIKDGNFFLVYEKGDVLDIFSESFTVENSVAGNIVTDLNIDGQKVLMRYVTNVVELEVRNDSDKHYRQVRFNMYKDKAVKLLKEKTIKTSQHGDKIFFFGKK
jgi:hypothetical protein